MPTDSSTDRSKRQWVFILFSAIFLGVQLYTSSVLLMVTQIEGDSLDDQPTTQQHPGSLLRRDNVTFTEARTSYASASTHQDVSPNPPSHALASNQMTIFISVFRQPKCLRQMIQYFRTCPVVAQVRINWFEDSVAPNVSATYFDPPNTTTKSTLAPFVFDILPNKLSHRFYPRKDILTEATFHVDVDTLYTCQALQFAMDSWQRLALEIASAEENGNKDHHLQQQALEQLAVGFHPRHLTLERHYRFESSFQHPFTYNTIFVTKGAIVHRKILEYYFDTPFIDYRNKVDQYLTAEDMLMSFVLASHHVKTEALCIDPYDSCGLLCAQGKQGTLASRTADARERLLKEYWSGLAGNDTSFLPIREQASNMTWSNATIQSWNHRCYSTPPSRHSISLANPTCKHICQTSTVCPRNPKRKDPLVWEE